MRALSQKTWHQWALLAITVITLILILTPDPADSLDPKTKLKMKLKKMKMKKVLGWMAGLKQGLAGGAVAGWAAGLKPGLAGGLAGGWAAGAGKSLWSTLAEMNNQKAKLKAREGGYGWGGSGGGGGGGGGWGGGSKEESIIQHGMDMARQMMRVKKGLLGAKSEILKAQGHMMVSTGVLLNQLLHSAESSGLMTYLTGGGGGGGWHGGGGGHEHVHHEPHHYQHSSPHHAIAHAQHGLYDEHQLGWAGWAAAKDGESYNSHEFLDLPINRFRPFSLDGARKHSQEESSEHAHDYEVVHVIPD